MSQSDILTIIIVGAGPGGLSLAQSIQKNHNSPEKKFNIKVFERETALQERWQGCFISLNSGGVRSLLKCVPESLTKRLHEAIPDPIVDLETQNINICDHKGSLLLKSPAFKFKNLHEYSKLKSEFTVASTYRDRLRDLLLEGIDVQWGKKCIGYEEDEEGVCAIFEDGSRVKGDFLIGADGINSPIRKQKIPDLKTLDIGITDTIVDVFPEKGLLDRLNAITGKSILKVTIGTNGDCMGCIYRYIPFNSTEVNNETRYRISMGYSYLTEQKKKNDEVDDKADDLATTKLPEDDEVVDEIKRRIKEHRPEGELTSIMLELWDLAKTRNEIKEEKYPHKATFPLINRQLKDIDPLSVKEWETTRVTLLGDAIHAMNPWLALGTNSAIEDASYLSDAFGNLSKDNWKENINHYEKEMRTRTSKYVVTSRKAMLRDHEPYHTFIGILFRNLRFKLLSKVMSVVTWWKGDKQDG
ncbi:17062_t:CDS:2 [Funneliformis geosporum]|uniref:17062_t:CDS:1 n=1 Tax=Funneliformis geosporum TaxID=1117311 RepID=A0A9W4WTF7_9GLOM|nr:17062_t:CDS:2 [Funneliformis geosporum]